jgi:hypothetical protein
MAGYVSLHAMLSFKRSVCVDWLRWTVGAAIGRANAVPPLECFDAAPDEIKPLPYYSASRKMRVGRMDWAPDRPSQGVMITLTGRDLMALRAAKQPLRAILSHIDYVKGRVTRLDVAIDVFGGGVTPDDVLRAWKRGEVKTPSKKILRWASADGDKNTGVTVQFGSRKSARCLRVYDKGKEQKTNEDWIRVELELHGRQATALMKAMVKYGVQKAGMKAVQSFLEGTTMPYMLVISDENTKNVTIEPPGRKDTNWERWVMDVALPAVLAALEKDVPSVREILTRHLTPPPPPR